MQETRSLEERLVTALPRLEKATDPSLKGTLSAHPDEMRTQLRRIEEILGRLARMRASIPTGR